MSTETIYRSLFVQARGVLHKELTAHLRTRRTMRRSRNASRTGQGRGGIVDAVSIRERPPEIEDRAVPGHWEGDLLAGSANTHIVTLVERQTRFLMLIKVEAKDTATVVNALTAHVQTLPAQLRASLTWDRGMELAEHKRFSITTDVAVYFCDLGRLAARHERKHQRPSAPVLPQEDRPVRLRPGAPRRHRNPAERQATQDARLRDPG